MGNCPCNFESEVSPDPSDQEPQCSDYHSNYTTEDFGLLGISVHYLSNQFMEEVRSAGLHEFSRVYDIENTNNFDKLGVIRTKGADVECPIDKKLGASYVHSILDKEAVGRADIMLSYAWAYSIGDIIDALVCYCKGSKRDPKRTFVWICCLCENQHRIAETKRLCQVVPIDEFRIAYYGRMKAIGHVLTMMIPWQVSTYLTRICCLFEVFMAGENECSITLSMPQKERNELMDAMKSGDKVDRVKEFFEILSNIDVADAKASDEDDLRNLQYLIENGVGYEEFNIKISKRMKNCALDFIESEVVKEKLNAVDSISKEQLGYYLNNVAAVFRHAGEYDRCLTICQEALRVNEAVHGQKSKEAARTVELIGGALYFQGLKEEALRLHESALVIREMILGRNHEDTASSMEWVAFILNDVGEKEEAMKMHKDVLEIRKEKLGWNHDKTASTLNFIALLSKEKGDYKEALRLTKEALEIFEKTSGCVSKNTSTTMITIGNLLYENGDLKEALTMFGEAHKIVTIMNGGGHPQTANIQERIDNISHEMGME